jgi:hypothetical protein
VLLALDPAGAEALLFGASSGSLASSDLGVDDLKEKVVILLLESFTSFREGFSIMAVLLSRDGAATPFSST